MRAHRFKLNSPAGTVAAQTASARSPASDWITEITEAWARGGTHTLELARLVLTARRRMCYGEWTQLWKSGEMPFSKRKGEMLVVIGERLGTINTKTFAHLPTGWSILYWLARLEWETLQKLVEQGTVHPKLRLQDAKRLAIKPWSRPGRSPSRKADLTRRLRQFRDYVERTLGQWKPDDRKRAKQELTGLIEQIDAARGKPPARNLDPIPKRGLSQRQRNVVPLAATPIHQTQGRL